MKNYSVAVVLLLSVTFVLGLTADEVKAKFEAAREKCSSDPATDVDMEAVRKWLKEGGDEPANVSSHILCMLKALKWQDENGKVSKSTMREGIAKMVPDKVDEITEKCSAEQENEVATPKHIFKCLRQLAKSVGVQ